MKKQVRKKVTLQQLEKKHSKILRRIGILSESAKEYLSLIEQTKKEIEFAPKPYVKGK